MEPGEIEERLPARSRARHALFRKIHTIGHDHDPSWHLQRG
jgi:hypothetical protein